MPDVFKKRASFTGRHFSAAKNRLSKIALKKRNGCLAPRLVQASLQFIISKLVYGFELYRAVYSLYLVSQFMVRVVQGGLQFTGLCSSGFRISKGGLQFIFRTLLSCFYLDLFETDFFFGGGNSPGIFSFRKSQL